MRLTKATIAAAFAASLGFAQTETRLVVSPDSAVVTKMPTGLGIGLPKWDRGNFLNFRTWTNYDDSRPNFWVFDRSGKQLVSTRIWPGNSWRMRLLDAAAVPGGGFMAVGRAYTNTGIQAGFMASVAKNGAVERFVQLSPFSAERMAVAPDGSLWLLGLIPPEDGIHEVPQDILAHYSADGKPLGTLLPRSSFAAPIHPSLMTKEGQPQVLCSKNLVAVYISQTSEWIEVSPQGKLLGRWRIPPMPYTMEFGEKPAAFQYKVLNSIAMTGSDLVFALFQDGYGPKPYQLDRGSHTWKPAGMTVSEQGDYIAGSDGEQLVLAGSGWNSFVLAKREN